MADLLRLLVAGRCGDAVSQFMGGKLTDGVRSLRCSAFDQPSPADLVRVQALNKWMSAYDDSVEYIHQTLSYGIFPAVERILLLLEELKGWSMQYVHTFSCSVLSLPDIVFSVREDTTSICKPMLWRSASTGHVIWQSA
jgi:hypothetical protein